MLFAAASGENRHTKYRRDDAASIQMLRGTLIHNEKCSSTLLTASFGAAMLTAILLAMIAAAADPEDGVTFLPAANPLTENIFGIVSHSHLKARLDNQHRSCQFMDGYLWNLSTKRKMPMDPGRGHGRGLLLLYLPQETTRLQG
jgi:hypothetical protein